MTDTAAVEIELVIPDECEGCGACCKIFDTIHIEPDDPTPEQFTVACDPFITDHGNVARRKLKTEKCSAGRAVCNALDKKTCRCSIFDQAPRVCHQFPRGGLSCRMALLTVNHGMTYQDAEFWPGHAKFDDPEDGYSSERDSKIIDGRKFARRTAFTKKKMPSQWTCTQCFRQADTIDAIEHEEDCDSIGLGQELKARDTISEPESKKGWQLWLRIKSAWYGFWHPDDSLNLRSAMRKLVEERARD